MVSGYKYGTYLLAGLALAGCSNAIPSGPVAVRVVQPITGQRCLNRIAGAQLETLQDLSSLSGRLGKVVMFNGDIDANPQTLETGAGFFSIDTQFVKGSDGYVASDFRSLLGASLYYATEVGYKLHARLNPAADFLNNDPTFAARSFIIADAHRTDAPGEPHVTDNAEYYPSRKADGTILNYLISYPNDEISEMPLGLNLGIMVHEYSHLVFQNVFPDYDKVADGASELALAAIDEGLADYFGYLATGDPTFFLCTFPGEDRDLTRPKYLTSAIYQSMQTGQNYDSHEGGAVLAAINYEIGQAIGPEENGKALSLMMSTLSSCSHVKSGSLYSFSFEGIMRCHAQAAGSRAAQIQQIYTKYLQAGGGL